MSNRIVKLPSVESFGRLTPDKWLLLKTLEESAEMVEAGKRLVKGDSTARRDLMGRMGGRVADVGERGDGVRHHRRGTGSGYG